MVALFVGAHPDDNEIGAGGTAAKLASCGWDVYFLILTKEEDPAVEKVRKQEARAAAAALGVDASHVIFADLPDGKLKAEGPEIGKVKRVLERRLGRIDRISLVFTHSEADVHRDHLAAHGIVEAALKEKPILLYPIVNHLKPHAFKPRVFVDVAAHRDVKRKALGCYSSQYALGRIQEAKIEALCRRYSRGCRSDYVEAFELTHVLGTSEALIGLAKGLDARKGWTRRRTISAVALSAATVCVAAYLLGLGRTLPPSRGIVVVNDFVPGSHVSGRVIGIPPGELGSLKVLVYVLTDKWYIHPWDEPVAGKGYAAVAGDGSWTIETVRREHQAKRVAFLLVRRETRAPAMVPVRGSADQAILSAIDHLAATVIEAPEGV